MIDALMRYNTMYLYLYLQYLHVDDMDVSGWQGVSHSRQQHITTILSPAQHPVITTRHQPVSTGWDTL